MTDWTQFTPVDDAPAPAAPAAPSVDWSKFTPVDDAMQDLPAGVKPSTAGAGRGAMRPPRGAAFPPVAAPAPPAAAPSVAPAAAPAPAPAGLADLGDPMGTGAAETMAAGTAPVPEKVDPLSLRQAGRDLMGGIEQVKGLATGAGAFGATVDWMGASRTLKDFDAVDAGQQPTATASQQGAGRFGDPNPVVRQYAQATPEQRQQLREGLQGAMQRDKGFVAYARDAVAKYNAEQERLSGKLLDFTDIRSARDFAEWAVRNSIATAPTMAASMVGALGGPAGLLLTSGGMAVGDMTSARLQYIDKATDPARAATPDRADDLAARRDDATLQHLADNAGATAALAVPYAGLDFLGPVGDIATGAAKGAAKSLAQLASEKGLGAAAKAAAKGTAKSVGEEMVNEGGQEVVNVASDMAAKERGPEVTGEDVKRVVNSAAVGGLMGAGGHAANLAGDALRPSEQRKEALARFDDVASATGLPPAAVDAVRKHADTVPAADLPEYLRRAARALVERGVGSAEDLGAIDKIMATPTKPPEEEKPKAAAPAPKPAPAPNPAPKIDVTDPKAVLGALGFGGDSSSDTDGNPPDSPAATEAMLGGLTQAAEAAGVPADAVDKLREARDQARAELGSTGNTAAPTTFQTEKGSTYQVHEDGTTTRDKAARDDVGHEGDSGAKPRSARTVYVDTNAAALSAAGLDNVGPRGARVALSPDGKATLLTWNEQAGQWGAAPSGRGIPVSDTPKVGAYPLELWNPKNDVPGYQAFSGMHAGNKITAIGGVSTPEPAGNPPVPAPAPVAAAPAADGMTGEAINRAWSKFAPELAGLGIPRGDMPQVAAEHRGALVNFLGARGITAETERSANPAEFRPTQAEFSPRKVQQARDFKGGDRAVLVSSDGFVIDGHHQWAAAMQDGKPLKVLRLNAPAQDLLRLAHQFPSSTTAGGARSQARADADAALSEIGALLSKPSQNAAPATPAESGNSVARPSPSGENSGIGEKPGVGSAEAPAGGARPAHQVRDAIQQLHTRARNEALDLLKPQKPASYTSVAQWAANTKVGKAALDKLMSERLATRKGQLDKLQRELDAAEAAAAKSADRRGAEARARRGLDPERDTLLQALAKLGGISRDVVAKEFGLKPEELKHTVSVGGLKGHPFRAKGGRGLDSALTALQEAGYFRGVPEEDVRRAFEEAIYGEIGGSPTLTAEGQARRAQDKAAEDAERARAELDAENEAEAAAEREAIMLAEQGVSEASAAAITDDDILWGASETDQATAMRAMGFTEKEIADATGQQAADAAQEGADQADEAADRPADGGVPDDGRPSQAAGADEGLKLEAQSTEDLRDKAAREEAATKAEKAKRDAEQARLKKEAEDRDTRARADATVDDFQLGQSAEQQLSGIDDLFADAPAPAPADAPDRSHLDALEQSLVRERARLAGAKTDSEKRARQVKVAQIEREIAGEREFLGLPKESAQDLSDDELAAELGVAEPGAQDRNGLREQDRHLREVASLAGDFAGQMVEDINGGDFAADEVLPALQMAVDQAKLPLDEVRAEVLRRLGDFDLTKRNRERIERALQPKPPRVKKAAAPAPAPIITAADMADSAVKQFTALFRDMAMGGRWNLYADPNAANGVAIYQEGAQPAGVTDVLVANLQGMQARTMANALAAELARRNEAPPVKTRKRAAAAPAPTLKVEAGDSEAMRQAKADAMQALGDIAALLTKNTRANITQEEEAKLLPLLTRLVDAAFRMGYLSFKQAARWSLDQLRGFAGDEVADQINLQMLQGAYLGMSGRHLSAGTPGVDGIAAIASVTSLDQLNEETNAPSTDVGVERDRGDAAPDAPGVASPAPAGGDAVPGSAGRAGKAGGRGGARRAGDPGLLSDGPAAAGNASDQPLRGSQRGAKPAGSTPGVDDDPRGGGLGDAGVQPDPPAAPQPRLDAAGLVPVGERQARQAEADKIPVKPGDAANIAATLPLLLEGQREDVLKAETRFAKPDGYGMMFTNQPGTGKTFTGLGIIKRFVRQGRGNVLVVVPTDKVIEDWIRSGADLGLTITQLTGTKDAGSGIVITTYANFGQNAALASRSWDLVVSDEAHYLKQEKSGADTRALDNLRAITLHPDGAHDRAVALHGDVLERAKNLAEDAKVMRMSDDERQWHAATAKQAEADAAWAEWKRLSGNVRADVLSRQGAARSRVVMLSATPFAYETSVHYAAGYLYEYPEPRPNLGGYNVPTPEQDFMIQHFGYRMRTGKLNKPDAKVDSGLLQRQFNSWLKSTGVLSSRMLDVPADYDRRFQLVDSAVGTRIDAAINWLSEKRREAWGEKDKPNGYSALSDALNNRFDYLTRRYLLEAIKATEVLPLVRQHMAMGRKVVVFHDYKKGGGFNPFAISPVDEELVQAGMDGDAGEKDAAARAAAFNAALDEFNAEFADLVAFPFASMPSPINLFRRELPGVLLFNGDVKPSDRRAAVAKFQDDASGPQVILVQSAAGKEGISLHDVTGKHQRVLFNLGQPTQPTTAVQQEGRIYRTGQVTDAIIRYLNTGTSWERWAFATTIAERASTTENLGLGESARALKDAFIAAFEESGNYPAGMEGEGTGGKERDRRANDALTEYDRAKAFYYGTQKKDSRTKAQEGHDYFATPEPVGLKMVQWADLRPGEDALEPSGGHGAIARWLPDSTNRTVVEPSPQLRARLAMVTEGAKIIDGVFEDLNTVNKFDGVTMNPPFNRPGGGVGSALAFEHLEKASQHLRPGGRIVALIPTGPAADKRWESWFYGERTRPAEPLGETQRAGKFYVGDVVEIDGTEGQFRIEGRSDFGAVSFSRVGSAGNFLLNYRSHYIAKVVSRGPRTETYNPAEGLHLVADIKLPRVTFERAGTQVPTRIVVIDKVQSPDEATGTTQRDLTGIEKIDDLFNELEHMSIRPRAKAYEDAAPAPAPAAVPAPAAARAEATATGATQAQAAGLPIVEHVTKGGKGRTLRGVVRKDLTNLQAASIDPYTFKKDGGWFIRAEHMSELLKQFPLKTGPAPKLSRAAPLYSELARRVEASPMKAGAPGAWLQFLKGLAAKGVKPDEIAWSGVEEWLGLQQGKVTREQIGEYLRGNGVQVQETTLGSAAEAQWAINDALAPLGYGAVADAEDEISYTDADGDYIDYSDLPPEAQAIVDRISQGEGGAIEGPTKYHNYTLPGGTNYREILLTLPLSARKYKYDAFNPRTQQSRQFDSRAEAQAFANEDATGNTVVSEVEAGTPDYRSAHWDQSNILAHIRVNDRTDADGKRVLFVEEIQSDWAQEGKKRGFQAADPRRVPTKAEEMAGYWEVTDQNGQFMANVNSFELPANTAEAALREVERRLQERQVGTVAADRRVPRAPFVDATDKWVALAIKRVVKLAVDGGYDRVAFVNGDQSAERYDLSKQVEEIHILRDGDKFDLGFKVGGSYGNGPSQKGISLDRVEELVGKEMAERIGRQPQGRSYLMGDDLKVGGEGMRAFYDKIVPAVAKDVLRKLGGGGLGAVTVQVPVIEYDRKNEYVGPTRTLDEVKGLLRLAESYGPPVFLNPLTGRHEMFAINRAANESPLRRVILAMQRGVPFEQAVVDSDVPQAMGAMFGGEIKPKDMPPDVLQQPGFDITPELVRRSAEGLPMFARGAAPNGGVNAGQVRAVSEALQAAGGIGFKVADTTADLPPAVRAHLTQMDPTGRTRGLFVPETGEVWVVARNIASADELVDVVLHESAHRGLAAILGNGVQQDLRRIYAANRQVRDAADRLADLHGIGKDEAIEEVLAELAGKGEAAVQPLRGWSALVHRIQSFVRSLGERLGLGRAWTDQQVRELVANATRVGMQQQPAAGGAVRLARGAAPDTEAFRRWFGDSKVVDADGKPLVVYHGTASDILAFDPSRSGGNFISSITGGIYFTSMSKGWPGAPSADFESASAYAKAVSKDGEGANVLPVYLSIKKPLVIEGELEGGPVAYADINKREIERRVSAGGYDGVVIRDTASDTYWSGEPHQTVYIAFSPEQIKSATGNAGTFDPSNPDIRLARGTPAAAPATPPGPGFSWKDEAGRWQFAPGAWLYAKLADKSRPLLDRLELSAPTPALAKQLRAMKVAIANAQEVAAAVATETAKLSEAERQMVSDIVERSVKAGTTPPSHAVRLAAGINKIMSQQTDELVALGMLSQESADRWRNQYLPRFYSSKLAQNRDPWLRAVRGLFQREPAMKGISGKHLIGRGLWETVPIDEVADWLQLGWEVRDPKFQPGKSTRVVIWRDYTAQERADMGEIRDAGFRFVMGYMRTQRDVAMGKMFAAIANDPTMASAHPQTGWVQVPETIAADTIGVRRYGLLSGMYVSPNVFSHLSSMAEAEGDLMRAYKKGLSLWKMGKTVLNPVSHMNNTLSNITMAHFAGVSYWDVHKYGAALRDIFQATPMLMEAKAAGLFTGTLAAEELAKQLPKDLQKFADMSVSRTERNVMRLIDLLTFGTRGKLTAMYEAEDAMFRYIIWRDARSRGLSTDDAVAYAQRYIFTYDDLPRTARRIRDFAIPFFSYTAKAAPVLLHTAMAHPLRLAAPAAMFHAVNTAAYALMAGGDDEDWLEKLQRYLRDPKRREEVAEKEQWERNNLPPWLKGNTALMTPRALRLGDDERTGFPLFLDITRIVPGGDIFDVSPNSMGLPIPQPLTPNHPLLSTFGAMILNRDPYFGKDIVDMNDTRAEAAGKRFDWLWKQVTPAIAFGNYHFERGLNVLAQVTGEPVTWYPGEPTGVGRDGIGVDPALAALQTVGIKVRPYDLERSEQFEGFDRKKLIQSIDAELRSLGRQNAAGTVSDAAYERAFERALEKKDRIRSGLTVDGDAKD